MGFHRIGYEVEFPIGVPFGYNNPVLFQHPQVVPDCGVVQIQCFRELLSVSRLFPYGGQYLPSCLRSRAPCKEPPKEPLKRVQDKTDRQGWSQ